MLARNAVDSLALGKRLSHQGSLLVLAPAPSRLTQNNLHMASARDQSKQPVDRLGPAKILRQVTSCKTAFGAGILASGSTVRSDGNHKALAGNSAHPSCRN